MRTKVNITCVFLYLQVQPERTEEFIEYLKSIDRLDEAAVRLADIINNEDFVSKEGKSKHQVQNWYKYKRRLEA